jgi:hypothetical protein
MEIADMRRNFPWLLFAMLLTGSPAFAQAHSRPATAADFTGVFQLLEFPESQQPKLLKKNPWQSVCQFFGHYPGGYWLHQETSVGACANKIPESKPTLPQTVEWVVAEAGFIALNRLDVKTHEIWKVDRINNDTNLGGVNLVKGDLIMQLIDKDTKQVAFVRLLRKLHDAKGT